eukprot:CAMPEP_0201547614 /NCGR_PEP_ID=MMETSP0173_2-20130828/4094_1 /ASSEMBLY_ACC=CAM_ASM_000268 /TAXON_ID=218659 /ORGANISM="Vexillifera sp., Strain DIVA3 564/2" /LENGTH=199 /DNA_ID=CAMNT_0047956723 /DNA_START=345 /DNA_END=941 /DNA_ORIENTATION=+
MNTPKQAPSTPPVEKTTQEVQKPSSTAPTTVPISSASSSSSSSAGQETHPVVLALTFLQEALPGFEQVENEVSMTIAQHQPLLDKLQEEAGATMNADDVATLSQSVRPQLVQYEQVLHEELQTRERLHELLESLIKQQSDKIAAIKSKRADTNKVLQAMEKHEQHKKARSILERRKRKHTEQETTSNKKQKVLTDPRLQ